MGWEAGKARNIGEKAAKIPSGVAAISLLLSLLASSPALLLPALSEGTNRCLKYVSKIISHAANVRARV